VTTAKRRRFAALVNEGGVIAAAAMDQRGSLRQAIAAARGVPFDGVRDEELTEFKTAVAKILTPHTSAILLDPDFGLPAISQRARNCGLLLAYEADTFLNTHPRKLPNLLPGVTVRRLIDWGADAVKILIRYDPFDDAQVNQAKQTFVERVGAECLAREIPYFLEFTGYGHDDERKPEIVRRSMEEFSQPHYHADVLKVEFPATPAHSREEALAHFRAAADAASGKPFIYLSAGVSHAEFIRGLETAVAAGVEFSGVLCGRATWQDGIPAYARHGLAALEDWLAGEGVRNVTAINDRLSQLRPLRKSLVRAGR
jgi:tagatose 1,6-diphosphate aldolase